MANVSNRKHGVDIGDPGNARARALVRPVILIWFSLILGIVVFAAAFGEARITAEVSTYLDKFYYLVAGLDGEYVVERGIRHILRR